MALGKAIAILLFLPIYAALGGAAFRWWRGRRPQPDIQADLTSWLSYWLPRVIAFELWGLVGGAVVWFALAFVDPTLHGADEHYFILAGGFAFASLAILFVGIDAFWIASARRKARRLQSALGQGPTT